jgi:hypothetical protein
MDHALHVRMLLGDEGLLVVPPDGVLRAIDGFHVLTATSMLI